MSTNDLPITTGEANMILRDRLRVIESKLRAVKALPEMVIGRRVTKEGFGQLAVMYNDAQPAKVVSLLRALADQVEQKAGLTPRQIEQPSTSPTATAEESEK